MTISVVSIAYLLLIFVLFYLVRHDGRLVLLSLASLFYIAYIDLTSAAIVLGTSAVLYFFGRLIEKQLKKDEKKAAKAVTVVAIVLFVTVIFVLKYAGTVGLRLNLPEDSFLSKFVIPLGFSYYIFQSISYVTDIYKARIPAEKNPFRLFLYVAYFPKFISGPIERMEDFSLQMTKAEGAKLFRRNVLVRSAIYIAYGFFMKLVVADRLGIYVDKVFANYISATRLDLLVGSLGYTMQIYCDFAGYTAIAIGASSLFGIGLSDNFRSPYCSQNITEFWRRWHITLSNWLKDYIYIPLGGNAKGALRKLINVVIVFVVCGMWHGSGFSFLIWGLLHGLYSVIDNLLKNKGIKKLRTGALGRVITFIAVSFAWIFFRADGASSAIGYIKRMIFNGPFGGITILPFGDPRRGQFELVIALISVLVVIIFDIYSYQKEKSLPEAVIDKNDAGKIAFIFIFLFLTLIFGIYGPEFGSANYIYMNF